MQSVLVKAAGLYTFPNRLSSVPQGALLLARNVIINRDGIIESRRGFNIYGNSSGIGITDIVHQLMVYKGTLLRHFGSGAGSALEFDSDGVGTFDPFTVVLTGTISNGSPTVTGITSTSQLLPGMAVAGTNIPTNTTILLILNNNSITLSQSATGSATESLTFTPVVNEVVTGLRVRSLEQNGNFYFTTGSGIKKISVANASDLPTAVITNAGMPKALDIKTWLNSTTPFLNQESVVAYRITWGVNDANSNEFLSTPSARTLVFNPLTNLLIQDFNGVLAKLDTLALSTGIHAQTYVNTYKVALNATASTLRSTLISLAAGLDADIPGLTITNVVGSGTVVTFTTSTSANNIFQVGDTVVVTGVNPSAYNKTYTLASVAGTTLTANDTASGGYVSGGSMKRSKYALISQPTTLSASPTTDQLTSMQTYYNAIVAQLKVEPTGIITSQPGFLSATTSSGVTLKFTIPQGITTADFYQIYRTAQTASSTGVVLSSLDPGDEDQLVYESNPTNTDLNNGYIQVNDITPDSFRGAYLYTNPVSGDGIQSANDLPPLARDLCSFKGYTFYANTQTKERLTLNMLAVSSLSNGTSTFKITDGTTSNTYTFVTGVAQIQTVTTVADVGGNLNSKYFTFWNGQNQKQYYVWYSSGAGVDPAVSGATGIQVTFVNNDTANTIASLTKAKINQQSDFTASVGTNIVTITNATAGVSTAAANGAASPGFAYSVTTAGVGEDTTNKKVLISTLSTPAQQVDESARSLVHVINSNASELVYAYYLSGPSDVPGQILLEARNLGQNAFYLQVNNATTTGSQFSPALPTSGSSVISNNEVKPNRIYYSKYQSPDSVPILNYLDVGATDKKILRILALRDNLYALKEEGIYRISGLVSPFTVSLFDSSTYLKAPDSAVVLNNLIYGYASQGVVTISDTGVKVISRPIEDQLIKLTTPNYSTFSTATFGVSYESDRSYYLWTVSNTTDTYATQVFHYNTFTQAWTQADQAKRCGIVNYANDTMYLGPTDTNFVEKERKNFDRTDFADREVTTTLGSNSVNGTVVTLPNLTGISVGDVLTQTQYLTIGQFNQLLTKLDADTVLTDKNYVSTLTARTCDMLSDDLDSLITKISNDAGRIAAVGSTAAATYTALKPTSSSSFSSMQTTFNSLIGLLNNDVGVGQKNFIQSTGMVLQESPILDIDLSTNEVTLAYSYPLIQGEIVIYAHIDCEVKWAPITMQDPSMTKHVSEGTVLFEDSSYSQATISYASDLSPSFEPTDFDGSGNGSFGNFVFGTGPFGGNGSGVPFRTLIPLEKQRCRYILADFEHAVAREIFSIYGLSLTYMPVSQRGYR